MGLIKMTRQPTGGFTVQAHRKWRKAPSLGAKPLRFLQPNGVWAYPFSKRYPDDAALDPLCSGGWPSIPRLKEHLLRKHAQRPKPRKQTDIPRQLPTHLTVSEECKKELEAKNRPGRDDEKWKRYFNVLFPDEPAPSPYIEQRPPDLTLCSLEQSVKTLPCPSTLSCPQCGMEGSELWGKAIAAVLERLDMLRGEEPSEHHEREDISSPEAPSELSLTPTSSTSPTCYSTSTTSSIDGGSQWDVDAIGLGNGCDNYLSGYPDHHVGELTPGGNYSWNDWAHQSYFNESAIDDKLTQASWGMPMLDSSDILSTEHVWQFSGPMVNKTDIEESRQLQDMLSQIQGQEESSIDPVVPDIKNTKPTNKYLTELQEISDLLGTDSMVTP